MTCLALLALTTWMAACSDDDSTTEPTLDSKEVVLVNDTSGSAADAGLVKFQELADGNASIQIQLDSPYRNTELSYPAAIVSYDSVLLRDSVYADLGTLSGTSGLLSVSPVIWKSTNEPISYDSLFSLQGYRVRIGVDTLVEAEAAIQ